MSLEQGQKRAFEAYLTGRNLFITGSGGKGKSFLVNKIIEHSNGGVIAVTPTAIAGIHIGAVTIHSQFKFPMGYMYPSRRNDVNQAVIDLFKSDSVKTLLIDEISMVRSDYLEAIDIALRKARRTKHKPFGGIQVIVVGDFFQLPSFVGQNEKDLFYKEYKSEFCFSTQSWKDAGFVYCELDKVMRQSDEIQIGHLENIRQKLPDFYRSIDYFNKHGNSEENLQNPVILCVKNDDAEAFNIDIYDSINEQEFTFYAKKVNYTDPDPVPGILKLKIGCKVMCRANTPMMINGETGVVESVKDDYVFVRKSNGTRAVVKTITWNQMEYVIGDSGPKQHITGSYEQLPLVLGYATTIHKSQGLSLDEVALYLGKGCFSSGQLYVALSRCKTIEGFRLIGKNIEPRDVIVNEQITNFYKKERNRGLNLL